MKTRVGALVAASAICLPLLGWAPTGAIAEEAPNGDAKHGPTDEGAPTVADGAAPLTEAPPELPEFDRREEARELVEERTPRSKTFTTGNPGERRIEISAAPLHVERDGQLIDVDPSWAGRPDGRLAPRAADVPVSIAASAAAADLVVAETSVGSLAFGLHGAADIAPIADGEVVSFPGVLPETDLRYTVLPFGVKEELVLRSPAAPRRFEFPLAIGEAAYEVEDDGTVRFTDAAGMEAASIPPPWMADASDPTAAGGAMHLENRQWVVKARDGSLRLIIELDSAWLDDPARVYPVIVDPTLVVDAPIADTYVNAGSTSNLSNLTWFAVGHGGAYANRALIEWDDGELDDLIGKQLQTALVLLDQVGDGSCEPSYLDAYEVDEPWSASTVQWPGPAVGSRVGTVYAAQGAAACPQDPLWLPVLPAVERWVADPSSNHGLELRARDEGDASQYKKVRSSEAGYWYSPKLAVTYTSGPTMVTTNITEDTVWGPEGSPYVVDPAGTALVEVRRGTTLTILPGTVVKFAAGKQLGVDTGTSSIPAGRLLALGTEGRPVTFTSIRDDLIGGDYDPQDTSSPERGDWANISFENVGVNTDAPLSVLDHVVVRFGGGGVGDAGAVAVGDGAQVLVSSSEITDADWAITVGTATGTANRYFGLHRSTLNRINYGGRYGRGRLVGNTFGPEVENVAIEAGNPGVSVQYNTTYARSSFGDSPAHFNSFYWDDGDGETRGKDIERNYWGHPVPSAVDLASAHYCYEETSSSDPHYYEWVHHPLTKDAGPSAACPGANDYIHNYEDDPFPALSGPPAEYTPAQVQANVPRFGPVNAKTGQLEWSTEDISIVDAGQEVAIQRGYRSDLSAGPAGPGWYTSYNEKASTSGDSGTVELPGGQSLDFDVDPDAGLQRTPGNHADWEVQSGAASMTAPDGSRYEFDATGELSAVASRDPGRQVDVSHTSGQLDRVTGVSGRWLDHDYASGLLDTITDSQNRVVDFGYVDGRLTSVTGVDGKTETYGYDAQGRLTSITSPEQVPTLTAAYDGEGRVSSFELAGQGLVTVGYFEDQHLTAFTRADGSTVVQEYDDLGRAVNEMTGQLTAMHYVYDGEGHVMAAIEGLPTVGMVGYAPQVATTVFDSQGDPAQEIDARGFLTETTFTSDHRPLVTTRPDGTTVERTYDPGTKRLASLTDPAGELWVPEYNTFGQLTRLTDPLLRDEQWDYDTVDTDGDPATGDLESTTNLDGKATIYTTHPSGRVHEVLDPVEAAKAAPDQHPTVYMWTAWGVLDSMQNPRGGTTTYLYNDDRQLRQIDGPASGTVAQRTELTYDAAGRLEHVIERDDETGQPLAYTTTRFYDAVGRVERVNDGRGKDWTQGYDDADRVVWHRDPLGGGEDYELDATGRPVETRRILDVGVVATTYVSYDAASNVTKIIHPDSGVETLAYDEMNRAVEHTLPRQGATWHMTYDVLGRPDVFTDPFGKGIDYDYDEVGRLEQVTDQKSQSIIYGYDGADRLESTSDPIDRADANDDVVPTHAEYDDAGRPVVQRDGAGNATVTAYFPGGLVERVTDPEGGALQYQYDAAGRQTETVDAELRLTTTTYDDLGRPIRIDHPGSTYEVFGYDASGNLTSHRDRNGRTWVYEYDDANRRTRVIDPDNGAAHPEVTTYDLGGRTTSLTDPAGVTVTFGYDAQDRRTSMAEEDTANADTWLWDPDGNLAESTVDGLHTKYTYDSAGRLDFRKELKTDGTTYAQWDYDHDDVGQLISVDPPGADENVRTTEFDARGRVVKEHTRPTAGADTTVEYVYDGADRIVSTYAYEGLSRDPGPVTLLRNEQVRYDGAGRVEQAWTGAAAPSSPYPPAQHEYFADGQLKRSTLPGGGVFEYLYDPAGRLDSEQRPDQSVFEFDFDGEGRMTAVRPPSGQDVTHVLDAFGRPTTTSVVDPGPGPDQTRTFTYDRAGRPTAAVDDHVAAGGALGAALVVADPGALTAGDAALQDRLSATMGLSVTVVDDATDPATVAAEVAVLAPSANGVHPGWTSAPIPTVVAGDAAWDDLALSTSDPALSPASTDLHVEEPEAELVAGPEDELGPAPTWVTVASAAAAVDDAQLGSGAAQVIAAAPTALDDNVVVAYEATAELAAASPPGPPAPARRAGVGFTEASLAVLSDEGWAVLDNAIWWARGHVLTGDGSSWTWGYDDAGRLDATDGPNEDAAATYDDWGRLETLSVAGRTTAYGYDFRGLIESVATGEVTTDVDWTKAHRLDALTVGGRVLDHTYDGAGRRTLSELRDGGNTRWSSATTYDAANRVIERDESAAGTPSVKDSFTYDAAGRIDIWTRDLPQAQAVVDFGFDVDGNRESVAVTGATSGGADDPLSATALGVAGNGTATWQWSPVGQLTAASDGTVHSYDADGRLDQVSRPGTATIGYGYDLFGDLAAVTAAEGGVTTVTASYERDALGRAVAVAGRSGPAVSYSFVGTGADPVASEAPARVANPMVVLADAPGVGRVRVWDLEGGEQMVAANSHGDVSVVASAAGGSAPEVVRSFGPFGSVASLGGSSVVPVGFQGDVTDAVTGLVDMGARAYDPTSGRFLQADTYRGDPASAVSLNRYVYGNSDPLNWSDPTGMFSVKGIIQSARSAVAAVRERSEAAKVAEEWQGAKAAAEIVGDYQSPDYDFSWEVPGGGDWDDNGYTAVQRAMLWCRGDYRGKDAKFRTCVDNQSSYQAFDMANPDAGGVLDGVCSNGLVRQVVSSRDCATANAAVTGGKDALAGIADRVTSPTEWFASIQAVEAGFDDGGFAGAAQAAYGEYVAPGVELAGCLLDGTSAERAYCAGGALTVLAVSAAVPSTAGLISRALRPRNATGSILRTGTSATRATGAADDITEISVSRSRYPQSAQHIEDAQAAGHPTELTIDRGGAAARRAESMRGNPRQPGLDRDEYPPAMFEEGGTGSSVRGIDPSDNRGAGASMGNQCRGLPDGSIVRIVIGC